MSMALAVNGLANHLNGILATDQIVVIPQMKKKQPQLKKKQPQLKKKPSQMKKKPLKYPSLTG